MLFGELFLSLWRGVQIRESDEVCWGRRDAQFSKVTLMLGSHPTKKFELFKFGPRRALVSFEKLFIGEAELIVIGLWGKLVPGGLSTSR